LNIAALIATAAMGYAAVGRLISPPIHTVAGVIALILCVAVHCIVFTYFMATTKWAQHAILVKRLDPAIFISSRSFRSVAFAAALCAMAAVFAAAMFGAWVDSHQSNPSLHQFVALGAIFINLLAAIVQARSIQGNGRIIDNILAAIGQQNSPATTKSQSSSSSSSGAFPPVR
jgi:hypothetical protein